MHQSSLLCLAELVLGKVRTLVASAVRIDHSSALCLGDYGARSISLLITQANNGVITHASD